LKTKEEFCIPVGKTSDGHVVYFILNPISKSLDCLVNGQKIGFFGYVSKEPGIKQTADTKLQRLVWHIDDVKDWDDMFFNKRMNIKPELMDGSSTLSVSELIKQAEEKTDNLDISKMSRREARRSGVVKPSKKIGFNKL
jgi:hypothetical protein